MVKLPNGQIYYQYPVSCGFPPWIDIIDIYENPGYYNVWYSTNDRTGEFDGQRICAETWTRYDDGHVELDYSSTTIEEAFYRDAFAVMQ